MSLLLLALLVMAALTVGYLLYGTFIARQYRLDDGQVTPAVARADGLDFTVFAQLPSPRDLMTR